MSHTKNLASYNGPLDKPGTRLDYPEFLARDFRLLETFGARMRARLGEGFKRCIKFDDSVMRLYLDFKLPEGEEWMSVTPEIAQEIRQEEDKKKADSIKRIIHANGTTALDELFKQIRMASGSKHPDGRPLNHNRDDFPTTQR